MKRCTWILCRVLLCGLLGCCLAAAATTPARAAEKPKTPAAAPMDPMMAEMMKTTSPGEEHKKLTPLVGSWKTTTKVWMGPGDPVVTQGTSEVKWAIGGRFVEEKYKGTFMNMPFEGMGLTGYDNISKQYVGTWVDNMNTGIMSVKGEMDSTGKTLTSTGAYNDPMTKQPKTMKMDCKIADDKSHIFSAYDMVDGKEVKIMEISYTRVK